MNDISLHSELHSTLSFEIAYPTLDNAPDSFAQFQGKN